MFRLQDFQLFNVTMKLDNLPFSFWLSAEILFKSQIPAIWTLRKTINIMINTASKSHDDWF